MMDILYLADYFIFTSQAKQAFYILNCLVDTKEGVIFILYLVLNAHNQQAQSLILI